MHDPPRRGSSPLRSSLASRRVPTVPSENRGWGVLPRLRGSSGWTLPGNLNLLGPRSFRFRPPAHPCLRGPKSQSFLRFFTPSGAKSWGSGGAPPTNLILLRNQCAARVETRDPGPPAGTPRSPSSVAPVGPRRPRRPAPAGPRRPAAAVAPVAPPGRSGPAPAPVAPAVACLAYYPPSIGTTTSWFVEVFRRSSRGSHGR